jgi:RimJ/RimL family protein N-acetyltransferase
MWYRYSFNQSYNFRLLSLDDVGDVFDIYSNKNVCANTNWKSVNVTRDLISQFVDECIGFDDRVVYSVVIGDRVIGLIFLHDLGRYGDSAEVGCMLSEDYWHRGIMSSLLSRILKRDEFEKYYARMYRENKSSMGLFKKLGFEIDDNFPKIDDEIVMVLRK